MLPHTTIIFEDRSLLLHIYKKSRLHFAKVASPLNPTVLNLQNPENSAPNDEPRATRRSVDHQHHFTCSHVPIRASHVSPWCLTRSHAPLQLYDVIMTLLPTFSLTRIGNPVRTAWKKKIFLKKALTKRTFDFDQKVKIFKKGLTHLVFSVHSNFGIRFIIRNLEIVQTVQFLKN